MALTNIEYGSVASSKVLNDNFNYLEDKIEDFSKNIASDKASLTSLINSQISTTFTQLTNNIQALYPVGAIYIGTTEECPIANLFGTWEKISEGRVLQGASEGQRAGSTVEAGLPNITGNITANVTYSSVPPTGALYTAGYSTWRKSGTDQTLYHGTTYIDASRSSSIYGGSNTVQPPAYLVNIWRRTA